MGYTIDGYLNRIQGDQHNPGRDPGGARKETLDGVRHRAHRTFTALLDQAQKIRTDNSLSDVGKRQALTELAKKQDLSFFASPRTANAENIAQLRAVLFPVHQATGDPVLSFLREQEFRNSLKDQPQGVIMAAYAQALKDGNQERVRALTDDLVRSLVTADVRQRIESEHAKTAQPAVFANYEEAQKLKEHLDSLEIHARQVLQALSVTDSPAAVAA